MGGSAATTQNPLDADLLVVDETSMVDVVADDRAAAGGAAARRVVFVGDVDQLPSVGPGQVLRDLIESGRVPVVRLTEVFRQAAESRHRRDAHAVNRGEMPESAPPGDAATSTSSRRTSRSEPSEASCEMVTERIPKQFGLDPLRDVQVLTPDEPRRVGAHDAEQRAAGGAQPARAERRSRTVRLDASASATR